MKFALVEEQRREAEPGLNGFCPLCNSRVVPRCGKVRVHHWAHPQGYHCDPWKESETEWHRAWKGMFPEEWQEVITHAEGGEKHVADIKTDQGWVFEFQHSHLEPAERQAREDFYPKLVWVVDATRRKRDKPQLRKAWEGGEPLVPGSKLRSIASSVEYAALRDWGGSGTIVFFDFGEPILLSLFPAIEGRACVGLFSREQLISYHRPGATGFDELVKLAVQLLPGASSRRPVLQNLGRRRRL
jgi:competence protein CoiA